MGHTRRTITTLLVLLLPAGAGVVAVHASPTCERYVRTYVTVPVRNKVSKATTIAWAKWRVAHPNWKPNPHVHRPKYKMSQKEQVEKVAFACQVTPDPLYMDAVFTPSDLKPPPSDDALPPVDDLPPVETADVTFPDDIPPMVPSSPPFANPVFPSLVPPFLPPVFGVPPPPNTASSTGPGSPLPPIAPVPEPSSLVLLAIGLASTVAIRRVRQAV